VLGDSKLQVAVATSGPAGGSVMKWSTDFEYSTGQVSRKGDCVKGLGIVDWLGKPRPGR